MSKCWIWPGPKNAEGYGLLKCQGVYIRAHRVIYEAVYGRLTPSDLCVLHKCDNPPCVNPMHLFAGTVADNNHDMTRKGRGVYPRGVHHGMAKLTEDRVLLLRKLRQDGRSLSSLSKEFGLAESTIVWAIDGRTWHHVPAIRADGGGDG